MRAFTSRAIRATALVVRDRRIPRPLRWVGALALLPVPGPFDEALLALVAVPLFLFYRRHVRDAWQRAAVQETALGAATRAAPAGCPTGSMAAEVRDVGR